MGGLPLTGTRTANDFESIDAEWMKKLIRNGVAGTLKRLPFIRHYHEAASDSSVPTSETTMNPVKATEQTRRKTTSN
jgi:hypothetical protein